MDEFTKAYIECMLWSSTGDDEEPLDDTIEANLDNFTKDAVRLIRKDCHLFQLVNAELIEGLDDKAGHDFWLTRNGHGTGFWDKPEIYGEENAKLLTVAAKNYGSCSPIICCDGKVDLFDG